MVFELPDKVTDEPGRAVISGPAFATGTKGSPVEQLAGEGGLTPKKMSQYKNYSLPKRRRYQAMGPIAQRWGLSMLEEFLGYHRATVHCLVQGTEVD